jgi:hypothetical protein
VPRSGTGRPGKYCSDLCRKAAHRERKRTEEAERERLAAIRHAEDQARMELEHATRLACLCAEHPGFYAGAIRDWIARGKSPYGSNNSRDDMVWSLLLYLNRLDPAPALPFVPPR